jgi:hypothetical protein
METPRDLGAAAFALANVVIENARVPLRALEHLPGMGLLTREGVWVRRRVRSRLDGLVCEFLGAPEVERAVDRVLAGARDRAAKKPEPSPDPGDATRPVPA